MTYTTNAEESYDHGASIREDLRNRIAIMTPVSCPLQFHLQNGPRVGATTIEWTADSIDKPETTLTGSFGGTSGKESTVPEGADATFPAEDARQRMANYTHIVRRAADISDTQRTMNQAGVTDEYAYKIWKAMISTAEQFDYNLHFGTDLPGAVGGGAAATNARMTHGVIPWIVWTGLGMTGTEVGNTTIAGQAIRTSGPQSRVGFSGTVYDSAATLTRANFHTNMLEPAHIRGMTIDGAVAFVSTRVKNIVSEFALAYDGSTNTIARNDRNIDARAHQIVDVVDVYTSNYGSLYFNLDRHLYGTETHTYDTGESPGTYIADVDETMFILEKDFWEIRMLRGMAFVPLAKIGDATKGMTILEGTLQCSNPIAGIVGNNLVT